MKMNARFQYSAERHKVMQKQPWVWNMVTSCWVMQPSLSNNDVLSLCTEQDYASHIAELT